MKHAPGEAAGLGVLAAGVVAAEQGPLRALELRGMRKARLRLIGLIRPRLQKGVEGTFTNLG